jgi:hypothetical protein
MPIRERSTPYEVYCNRCSVTFPVGQRHCLHCGGRLSNERLQPGEYAVPAEPEEIEIDDDLPTRSLPFSPLALVWAVLLIGGSLYRACAGG